MLLLAILAAAIIAAAVVTALLLLRRTTISVIIRKDPDMATIKERLAILEADRDALKAQLANHDATLTGVASMATATALTSRVEAVEAEIGADPAPSAPTAASDPAPQADPGTPVAI